MQKINQRMRITMEQQTTKQEIKQPITNPHLCPECGGVLIKQGGCKVCMNCGYEVCGI